MRNPTWMYGNAGDKRRARLELEMIQAGRCGGCFALMAGAAPRDWHLDHDHATDWIRGLLCARCNQMENRGAWAWDEYLINPPATLSRAECWSSFAKRAKVEEVRARDRLTAAWSEKLANGFHRAALRAMRDREAGQSLEEHASDLRRAGLKERAVIESIRIGYEVIDAARLEGTGLSGERLLKLIVAGAQFQLERHFEFQARDAVRGPYPSLAEAEQRAAESTLEPHDWVWISNADPSCGFQSCPFNYETHPHSVQAELWHVRSVETRLVELADLDAA